MSTNWRKNSSNPDGEMTSIIRAGVEPAFHMACTSPRLDDVPALVGRDGAGPDQRALLALAGHLATFWTWRSLTHDLGLDDTEVTDLAGRLVTGEARRGRSASQQSPSGLNPGRRRRPTR